jgi:regulator of RNase E activity RraA
MALRRHEVTFETLSRDILDGFNGLAASQVGDAMNREQIMAAAIKPIAVGTRICGQARTVNAMAGDNGIIHAAIPYARPGEILVVNGMGVEDVAIWGEVMTHAAQKQGIAGIVLDGAVRDVAEMREMGFPVFCRAVVPRGPHKGFGGTIDGAISCAGVAVSPGDLVIGDDDGVARPWLRRSANGPGWRRSPRARPRANCWACPNRNSCRLTTDTIGCDDITRPCSPPISIRVC